MKDGKLSLMRCSKQMQTKDVSAIQEQMEKADATRCNCQTIRPSDSAFIVDEGGRTDGIKLCKSALNIRMFVYDCYTLFCSYAAFFLHDKRLGRWF